ncbi:hypothetical protein [Caldivirga sp.]|uniref:hypothetical protein n=1 Tax=Caldivirga sp. TaxID=2080243 RepID=UPI0025B7D7F3|nr:hypothetical protein [Caldivirga sp.]
MRRFLFLITLIAALALVLVHVGIHAGGYGKYKVSLPSSYPSNYTAAFLYLGRILTDAKEAYENASSPLPVGFLGSDPGLARSLILNSTIFNETTLLINGTPYRYIILSVWCRDCGFSFNFELSNASMDGVSIYLRPRNTTVTYTGGLPFTYVMSYDGVRYEFTLWYIGLEFGSFRVFGYSQELGKGVYAVQLFISTPRSLDVEHVWLVLIKENYPISQGGDSIG